jgi:hypothetical protein
MMAPGIRGLAAAAMMLGLAGGATAQPAATDHDGAWQFILTCSPNSSTRAPGFTERFAATIANGQFARTRTIRMAEGPEIAERWQGAVREGRMEVMVESARGPQRWTTRLAGTATSPARFDLTGGVTLADNRQVRSCTMSAALERPAPASLAARGPRAEQERQQREAAAQQQRLAAVETALAAAMMAAARAEERGDALQTELDLARFEGTAMREEMARREAALAAAARAVAEAQQQNTTLGQRVGQAEGALAQFRAQAEAAFTQLRTEAEGRVRQLEGALAQLRGEADGRIRQSEAALTQLRTELDQARRSLAEREAAQPRQ